jgi:hypothetical protein
MRESVDPKKDGAKRRNQRNIRKEKEVGVHKEAGGTRGAHGDFKAELLDILSQVMEVVTMEEDIMEDIMEVMAVAGGEVGEVMEVDMVVDTEDKEFTKAITILVGAAGEDIVTIKRDSDSLAENHLFSKCSNLNLNLQLQLIL